MKNKRTIACMLSFAVLASMGLSGCRKKEENNDTNTGNPPSSSKANVIVWAPEEVASVTREKLNSWLSSQEQYRDKYTLSVSAMGEGEAATQMLTDVEAGADVYSFAQDQLARLVAAGALSSPGGKFEENIRSNNDSGSVSAATLDDKIYAYPETSDNGYFLYYDKSVVTDPSTLEGILEQCGEKGKKLYMDIQSGWYSASFFFGTGADCYYEYDKDGNVTGAVCDYGSEEGLAAFKGLVAMASNPAFSQSTGSDAALFNPDGGTAGAVISGTWDSAVISEYLGENYGAAKLPTFSVDGTEYQLGGFGGFKLVGVKPQTDSDKLTFCHLLADYLTGEEMQAVRFESNGWGPSNVNVQESEAVQSDIALSALSEQLQYCVAQGQYPNAFWTLTEAFGTDINSGKYENASDEELMKALDELEAEIKKAK